MPSTVACVLQKERAVASALLGIGLLFWTVSRLPVYRSELEHRLLRASGGEELVVADLPTNLGHLEPKGRINPDGSEVWGYPAGSELEDLIEVHVKDGRVVREVLRPSAKFPAKALSNS